MREFVAAYGPVRERVPGPFGMAFGHSRKAATWLASRETASPPGTVLAASVDLSKAYPSRVARSRSSLARQRPAA